MSILKITDIHKSYRSGEIVHAIKGVSLEFRRNEFVSILGPSGCGKTTLLNLIGGLDRYDSGVITLGGIPTKNYKDSDWDAYRNRSIGFVFQNYNLIGHQTVLQNVEIAMTLSGISAGERRQRAKEALKSVGILDQANKRPNQLSGGQMQRAAIARALVNNPDIILADEPTGSLDSGSSVPLMETLKEISKTRLVILVTHNTQLAENYSSRIIRMLDGVILSDSNPIDEKNNHSVLSVRQKSIKTSMSMKTATGLSLKNLLSKRGRTIITSIAGSIGIISIALVLALSTGVGKYMNQIQIATMSGFPITISENVHTIQRGPGAPIQNHPLLLVSATSTGRFIKEDIIYRYDETVNALEHKNILTQKYFDYISNIQTALPDSVAAVSFTSGIDFNLLAKGENSIVKFEATASRIGISIEDMIEAEGTDWQEMPDNKNFILSIYELIGEGGKFPQEINEIALVVDYRNRINKEFFEKLGLFTQTDYYDLADFIGATLLKVIPNDSYYTRDASGVFLPASLTEYHNIYTSSDGIELTITGILRIREDAGSLIGPLTPGFLYTPALRQYVIENASNSEIAATQRISEINILTGTPFRNEEEKNQILLRLGVNTMLTGISIFPIDFNGKNQIKEYLDVFNMGKPEVEQIVYSDVAYMLDYTLSTATKTISIVLLAFAAIALIVSTIMIGIITYVSVIERTKEIGILRSVGARKKDIARVFIAEALIVGFTAGAIGIITAFILIPPINSVVEEIVGVKNVASMIPFHAVTLIAGSMALTMIAGFIPSSIAAKKDPVVALRTE